MEYNRKDWLEGLNPGDKVASAFYDGLGEKCYKVFEVKTITRKGNIRLTNDVLLNSNGNYNSKDRFYGVEYSIEPLTKEVIAYENDRRRRYSLSKEITDMFSSLTLRKYSVEQLEGFKDYLSTLGKK